MSDDKQVIAKVPNPNAGRPHFTTASEVATMQFVGTITLVTLKVVELILFKLRDELGYPVPQVLVWSLRAQENTVGAEFIIMEKAHGVSLNSCWPNMGLGERWKIAQTVARFQQDWTSTYFPSYGSLYLSSDLSGQPQPIDYFLKGAAATTSQYAIGPITGRDWNDDSRTTAEFDRGPCESGSKQTVSPSLISCREHRS